MVFAVGLKVALFEVLNGVKRTDKKACSLELWVVA
jgi:hypothetical protein